MPHIDTSGAETPDPAAETMDTAAAQRVEQERMTRRAALRKLGFGAGIAAFSLLGVDDFARMVGQRLERNARDNKTAMAVAKEFQSAGIAFAEANPSGPSEQPCHDCISGCESIPCYFCADCGSDCDSGIWPFRKTTQRLIKAPVMTDPTKCQDKCDQAVISSLTAKLPLPQNIKDCVSDCAKGNLADMKNCTQDCLSPVIPSGNTLAIQVKAYLECCYTACDAGCDGTPSCKF